jgi:hypothetical protein
MATNSLVVEHTITDAERIAALRRRGGSPINTHCGPAARPATPSST